MPKSWSNVSPKYTAGTMKDKTKNACSFLGHHSYNTTATLHYYIYSNENNTYLYVEEKEKKYNKCLLF